MSETSSSSSSLTSNVSKLRRANFHAACDNPAIPTAAVAVLDMLFHVSTFSKVLAAAEPLGIIGSEIERAAFADLKEIFRQLDSTGSTSGIDIGPFLIKLSSWSGKNFNTISIENTATLSTESNDIADELSPSKRIQQSRISSDECVDVIGIWDIIIKLIMVVIPPLREVFLGHVANAQEVPGWLNLMSRCFKANFTAKHSHLEDLLGKCYSDVKENFTAIVNSATVTSQMSNAMVLSRAPEIFVVSIASSLLASDVDTERGGKNFDAANDNSGKTSPTELIFPSTLDLNAFAGPRIPSTHGSVHLLAELTRLEALADPSAGAVIVPPPMAHDNRVYELTSVVALEKSNPESPNFDRTRCYFRSTSPGDDEGHGAPRALAWYRSCGPSSNIEEVDIKTAIENNYYNAESNPNVHPRLLIYTRKDIDSLLTRTTSLVSRAGQMRALGDVAFALAIASENYDEARRCYEEAILLDGSLRPALMENLNALGKFERTQRAKKLEEQADLALANKRFKEASEQYKGAKRSAIVGSGIYMRVKDKDERVTRLLTLDAVAALSERGEHHLQIGSLQQARELFAQAYKLTPEFLHLHTIMLAIDRTMHIQAATQKESEATQAMKAQKYRLAQSLFLEVLSLAPERNEELQKVIVTLGPLIQGEDATTRQRLGLAALEDKRYNDALASLSEAIELLPPNSQHSHALFLADRALVCMEMKDLEAATQDCNAALEIKPDLAIAHFRLGAAKFGLECFDDATTAYEKASKFDSTLADQVKAKLRQINSAREVQQRKLREEERARAKEEQDRILKEKREKEEQMRRDKVEKAAKEKAERARIKEEERQQKLAQEQEALSARASEKEAEAERKRIEREEAMLQKAREKEAAKVAKEAAKERERLEKEQRAQEAVEAQRAEQRRRKEQEEDQERALAKQREEKAAKEAEKEKARLERERTIAEREKARKEKLAATTAPGAAPVSADTSVAASSKNKNSNVSNTLDNSAKLSGVPETLVRSGATPPSAAISAPVASPPAVNSWTSRSPITALAYASTAASGTALLSSGLPTVPIADAKLPPTPLEEFPPLAKETRIRENGRDPPSQPMLSQNVQPAINYGISNLSSVGTNLKPAAGASAFTVESRGSLGADLVPASRSELTGLGNGLTSGLSNETQILFSSELNASSKSFVYSGASTVPVASPFQAPQQPSHVPAIAPPSSAPTLNALPEPPVDNLFSNFGSSFGLGFGPQNFLGSSPPNFGALENFGAESLTLPLSSLNRTSNSGFPSVSGLAGSLGSMNSETDPILRALGGLALDSPTGNLLELPSHAFGGLTTGISGLTDDALGMGISGLHSDMHNSASSFSVASMLAMESMDTRGSTLPLPSLLPDPLDPYRFHQQHTHSPPRQQLHKPHQLQGGPIQNIGIDADIVRSDLCMRLFPAVGWLGQYGINMYHWAGDSNEWTEFALHLPQNSLHWINGPNGSTFAEIQRISRCAMWLDREILQNKNEMFLVFHRGPQGHESNTHMNSALAMVSDIMRGKLQQLH